MNNFFKKLHLWVSVPFGIVITITCFTGALLVFESDIVALYNKDLTAVVPMGDPLPVSAVAEKVEAGLADGVEVTGVVVSGDPAEAYKVNISKPSRTAVYVDQYTGEVKGKVGRLPFFNTVRRLHRWLMDSRPDDGGVFWGKLIVGISTLMMALVIITGMVIWWPKSMKMWINRSKVALRLGWHRFWYDLHVAGGIYATLLLLVMALTGLTWSFEWYRTGFYRLLGGDAPAGKSVKHGKDKDKEHGDVMLDYQAWQSVYDRLGEENPDARKITLSHAKATVSPSGFINQRATDSYTFDAATGEILSSELYRDRDKSRKLRGAIYSIHVGNFGGLLTKVLWFLAALLGATLPLTGYYLWIKRKFFRKH